MTFEVHTKLPEKSYQVAVLAKNAVLFVMSFVDKRERDKRESGGRSLWWGSGTSQKGLGGVPAVVLVLILVNPC